MRDLTPALDARRISVHFGGVVAVDEVDLTVQPGEVVGIIGPNGAGKSTLLDAACGFAPLETGSVALFGDDVTDALPYRRARHGMARSFQDPRLFPGMTVRDVLLGAHHPSFTSGVLAEALRLPWARRDERAARDALDGLLDAVDLDAYLDHAVAELSLGTARAVELAWLAARRPRLLLLDEPASGLQQSEVRALAPLLERIRQGAAMVVVDHDVPFVSSIVHRLVAMDLGRIVADGSVDEVLHHPDVIESYLGTRRYEGAPQ